ncbi:MAG: hypothetical protein QG552_2171 [Thermodesulfobacteriota bacterium]|nr:hypothetical protein [Thermodesulfobacteriota bacterium]
MLYECSPALWMWTLDLLCLETAQFNDNACIFKALQECLMASCYTGMGVFQMIGKGLEIIDVSQFCFFPKNSRRYMDE